MTKSIHVCATLALCLAGAPGVDVARAADALGMIETRGVFSPGQADILVGLAIDGFSNVGPGEVELAVQGRLSTARTVSQTARLFADSPCHM